MRRFRNSKVDHDPVAIRGSRGVERRGSLTDRLGALWGQLWSEPWAGPYEVSYGARVAVWMRWLVALLCVFLLVYRPTVSQQDNNVHFIVLVTVLVAFNGSIHYRILTGRPVVWQWMLGLHFIDVALITLAAASAGGMTYFFFHLMYYPALAFFAALFTSFRLNMVWVTFVAAVYVVMCLTVGDGIDIEAREDKTLIARVVMMYAVVVLVNLVARSERIGRRLATEREMALQRERAEVSRTIHDTVAQTVYMIGLGVQQATRLADGSNEEMAATLAATDELAKSAMWELRRPLAGGQIYEGSDLGDVLRSHVATFTTVTSVPAEVMIRGVEPSLTTDVRNRLFSVAHNALTNAYRHARAGGVEMELDFRSDSVRLSVSDDGVGLPDDYADRGYGFAGMRADAEAVGGMLTVKSDRRGGGTSVTCTVPL